MDFETADTENQVCRGRLLAIQRVGEMVMIGLLHWAGLTLTFYLCYRLFRDLADVSQWVIETSREQTMWTFYNRHKLALAIGLCWVVASLAWWQQLNCATEPGRSSLPDFGSGGDSVSGAVPDRR